MPPLLNIKLKNFDNKKPCSPFVYKGFYCPFGEKCKFAHPTGYEAIGDDGNKNQICKFIEVEVNGQPQYLSSRERPKTERSVT